MPVRTASLETPASVSDLLSNAQTRGRAPYYLRSPDLPRIRAVPHANQTTYETITAVYAMFSSLMQPPTPAVHQEIMAGKPARVWDGLSVPDGTRPAIPENWLPAAFPLYDQWRRIYNNAMPPANPLIVPVESIYKVWTTDPSCEMPFARETGLLQGDSAQHLYQVYCEIGFELPTMYADRPDHLVLELEFMGLLVEAAEPAVQLLFISQHLDWLPRLVADAEHKEAPALYLDLFRWIEGFLALERRRVAQAAGRTAPLNADCR